MSLYALHEIISRTFALNENPNLVHKFCLRFNNATLCCKEKNRFTQCPAAPVHLW